MLNPISSCNSCLTIFAKSKVPVYWQVLNVLPTETNLLLLDTLWSDKFFELRSEKHRALFIRWFEFPEISSDKWNRKFPNFRKKRQPCEVYRNFWKFLGGNLRLIWLSSQNFRNFRLIGSLIAKFINFWLFWKLSQEISTICPSFEIFGIFG